MHTATVHEYELPRELLKKARDLAVRWQDKDPKNPDFDYLLKIALHELVLQACWEEFGDTLPNH